MAAEVGVCICKTACTLSLETTVRRAKHVENGKLLFASILYYIEMRPKNNYILRFDNRELAKSCFCYFPVKAIYSDGFTTIISGASDAEWKIYKQVIELLRSKKLNICTNSY